MQRIQNQQGISFMEINCTMQKWVTLYGATFNTFLWFCRTEYESFLMETTYLLLNNVVSGNFIDLGSPVKQ